MMRSASFAFILLSCTCLLRAQDAPEVVQDNDTSPYHLALLDYKAGKFQEAFDALSQEPKGNTDPAEVQKVAILDSKILTELKRYDEGEKVLRPLLTPTGPVEVQLALGDVLLHKHSFERAGKYYALALQAKPDDPDVILKLVYARVGGGDLVGAGQYASQLKPIDPKNPYDMHASYYFAKAALAQASGKVQDADDAIQQARTNYGNTITDRYLKTYLEVFAAADKSPNSDLTPPPLVKPAPDGAK